MRIGRILDLPVSCAAAEHRVVTDHLQGVPPQNGALVLGSGRPVECLGDATPEGGVAILGATGDRDEGRRAEERDQEQNEPTTPEDGDPLAPVDRPEIPPGEQSENARTQGAGEPGGTAPRYQQQVGVGPQHGDQDQRQGTPAEACRAHPHPRTPYRRRQEADGRQKPDEDRLGHDIDVTGNRAGGIERRR